jgi:glycosyltransferase involved in cell wall biosynthesis
MKILVFNNTVPNNIGGAERAFDSLCKRLAESGNEVYALFPDNTREWDKDESIYKKIPVRSKLRIRGYSISFLEIMYHIKEIDPDVLHLADGLSPTDLGVLILNSIFLRLPVFVDVVAFYRNPVFNFFVKLQLPFYNLATGIGPWTPKLKSVMKRWFVRNKKFIPGYNPPYLDIDSAPTMIHGNSEVFTYIFVGVLDRNHSYKGLDLLLKAIKFMNDEFPMTVDNIKFTIVGGGEDFQYYRDFAIENGLENLVFRGRVADLNSEYAKSDALVLPSRRRGEGFGKVVLEALSMGIPVLVSKYAGAAYIPLEYRVGETFDPYRTEEFAKKLMEFAKECSGGKYLANIMQFQLLLKDESKRSISSLIAAYSKSVGAKND